MLIVLVPVGLQFLFAIAIISLLLDVQMELEAGARIRKLHLKLNQVQWHTMDEFLFSGGIDPREPSEQKVIAHSMRDSVMQFFDKELIAISKEYMSASQIAEFKKRVHDLVSVVNWSSEKLTTGAPELIQNRDEAYRRVFAAFPPVLTEMQRLTDANDEAVKKSIMKSRQLTDRIFQLVGLSIPISFLVGVILGCFFSFSIKKPISLIADNSRRLSRGEPLAPVVLADEELKSLDDLLHEIAQAVDAAREDERALIENAADLVCFLDVDGTFLQVNSSAERILGLRKDDVIGLRLNDLTVPEDSFSADEHIRKTIISQESQSFKLRLKRAGDFVIDTSWSTFWLPSRERIFCVVRDVTEEEELARMKKDFVDMVSHDLRSPLTSLGITLEIIASGVEELPAAASQELNRDKKIVEALIGFINDLLDYQKFSEGRVELSKATLSCNEMIENAIESVEIYARESGIKYCASVQDLTVFADSRLLQQVITKLLADSIRVCSQGSLITVNAEKTDDSVRFSVTYPGYEIAESVRDKIFEPYEPESSSLNQNGGLALAVCKMIIEAHGGEIGVSDSPAQNGSSIWFTIESAGG